jgi:hypothetical protein
MRTLVGDVGNVLHDGLGCRGKPVSFEIDATDPPAPQQNARTLAELKVAEADERQLAVHEAALLGPLVLVLLGGLDLGVAGRGGRRGE